MTGCSGLQSTRAEWLSRTELWTKSFTATPHKKDQGFRKCVEETHVSWLMDTGLFEKRFPLPEARRERAMLEVRRMGYEYFISKVALTGAGTMSLTVENRGVAPFYADWPVEVELTRGEKVVLLKKTGFLPGILPGESRVWEIGVGKGVDRIRIRVPNPMKGGKPLRFANEEQGEDWLVVGK